MSEGNLLIPSLVSLIVGVVVGYIFRYLYARLKLQSAEFLANKIKEESEKKSASILNDAEEKVKIKMAELKESINKERAEFEKELKEKKNELNSIEKRLSSREENLDRLLKSLEEKERVIFERERHIKIREDRVNERESKIDKELEKIASLTKEEARKKLEEKIKADVEEKLTYYFNDKLSSYEEKIKELELEADKKAREILVSSMQRVASDVSKEMNITNITLPDDEMKGRIIGREGRNIRTLENLLGVDIIIDDTPEIVTVSGFDPIRRIKAQITLENLIKDGRIHPARIEEVYEKARQEVEQKIMEEGTKTLYELGISVNKLSNEFIRAVGSLYYRPSYGQNILIHSKEVAKLAAIIANEIGADAEVAKRAGLFHDIGKAIESDVGNKHVDEGVKLLKKIGESKEVIAAVAWHHEATGFPHSIIDEKEYPESIEAVIVRIADKISGSRPGVRYDEGAWGDYINRVTELEKEAKQFDKVEHAYALQAGREIRLFVKADVPESELDNIAKEMKAKIVKNTKIRYPGRIKITVVKEKRVVEHTD
jgi:ribonuclease Y